MVTTLKLIRHCNSRGNAEGFFQGQIDTDITDMGAEQLELIAERFKGEPLDAVYSSDLIRAHKTAEAVCRYHDIPLELSEELREISVGEWEGLNWEIIKEKFPEEVKLWQNFPHKFVAPAGESMAGFYERVTAKAKEIASKNQGKTVAVVTHGAVIRVLTVWAQGDGLENLDKTSFFDNTSISTITIDESGKTQVISLNDCGHLPDRMRKHWVTKTV